jgi:uncharacterized repeat protein (TIGR02543 family)
MPGDPFPEGSYADTLPSYMQGVSAFDNEDGPIDASEISHVGAVNTSIPYSVHRIDYSVTDSDYNTTTKPSMVFVGDVTVVEGIDYNIAGVTPIHVKLSDVPAINSGTASIVQDGQVHANLTSLAHIFAWNIHTGDEALTRYSPDTGLVQAPGMQVIEFRVAAEPSTVLPVTFIVDDDRLFLAYYANGATSGTAPAMTLHEAGTTAVVADQGTLQRAGYTFGGWSFTGNGGAAYQPGQTFTIHENVRLYAVWNAIPAPPLPPTVIVQPPVVVTVPGETTVVEVEVPYEVPEQEETTVIPTPEPPTTSPEPIPTNWSLVSLLLALIAFAAAVLLAVLSFRRRYEDEDEPIQDRDESRLARLRLFSGVIALLGLVPAVIFFILDDITGQMLILNEHTFIVAIAAVVELALIVIRLIMGRSQDTDDFTDGFGRETQAAMGGVRAA